MFYVLISVFFSTLTREFNGNLEMGKRNTGFFLSKRLCRYLLLLVTCIALICPIKIFINAHQILTRRNNGYIVTFNSTNKISTEYQKHWRNQAHTFHRKRYPTSTCIFFIKRMYKLQYHSERRETNRTSLTAKRGKLRNIKLIKLTVHFNKI